MANRERIEKWVEALESGEYEQTTGALQDNHGFCCLGVLCDVAIREGLEVEVKSYCDCGDELCDSISYDEAVEVLPSSVQEWAGLTSCDPSVGVDGDGKDSLAELNDAGLSFPDIADLIRSEYLS